jgi:8-oxo-dGTP diphosphatase
MSYGHRDLNFESMDPMPPTPVLNVSERRQQPPRVAVSTVIFALQPPDGHPIADGHHDRDQDGLWVPLVRRVRAPFAGVWALPGGTLAWNHSLEQSARETSASILGTAANYLEQLYSFGGTERSASDLRQVTIAYWVLLGLDQHPRAPHSGDAENLAWFPADALPPLAFDHAEIVAVARERLRAKTAYADIAGRFLGPEFTLAELRLVHDAVLGTTSDPANFRRRMLAGGQLEPTGSERRDGAHRPAQLFRFTDDPQRPTDETSRP